MQREAASSGLVKAERRRLFRAIRIALLLSALLPIAAGLIYAESTYRQRVGEATEQLGRAVALASEHSLRVFEGADSTLSEISQMPTEPPGEAERSIQRMAAILASRPHMRILGVTDAGGEIKVSAPWRSSMNVSWRDYFRVQRDRGSHGSLYVGTPIIGAKDTFFSVPISRAIRNADGAFAGIAFLALDRGYIGRFFESISGPSAETVGLLSSSGVLLTEHAGAALGADYPHQLAARIRSAQHETARQGHVEIEDADGRPNIVAFKAIGDYGLYAFASLRQNTIRAAWWLEVREVLMLLALPIAGLALAAFIAERQLRSLKKLVAALASNRARYRTIFNSSPDCNFLIGRGESGDVPIFLEVNQNSQAFFDLPSDQLAGRAVNEILEPAEASFIASSFQRCIEMRDTLQREHEVGAGPKPGHWEMRMAPLPGQAGIAIGSIRNIARQKYLTSSLRELTGRLLQRQDHERRQIARDLHDSAAQNLLAASLELKLAADALSRRNGPWHEHLSRIRDFIDRTQKEIRGVSYLLHPPMLDEAGLPNALHWFVDGFQRRTNIRLELRIGHALRDLRLPAEVEMALFRVAQEALANVHRHANASTVRLSLDMDEQGMLEFRVEDDGTAAAGVGGPDPIREGVGISGMRERLMAFEGTLTFRVSGQGATLSARVPLAQQAA